MSRTQLTILLRHDKPDRLVPDMRPANDNPDPDQERFERAAWREGAGEDGEV